MDMLQSLNGAIRYIEENLCGELSLGQAARIACVSEDSFRRFFSYMTGRTVTEYIRLRRLTLAAQEVGEGKMPLVELAVKYGYDSAAAFSRAFFRQHGIRPSDYRKRGGMIRAYPPVSFHIQVKGAREMNFRWLELQETTLWGLSRAETAGQGENRESLRHRLWAESEENIPGQLCEGTWNQPGSTAYDGVWYGIWKDGRYMIAREEKKAGLEKMVLPAGLYAAFQTEKGGLAWEELPRMIEGLESWLPASGCRKKETLLVEVYHLRTDHDARKQHRYYEIWAPVEKE